ncbi:MAG TPA: hypothetical protein VHV82_07895 [Sporichthyaceae bacterium]|jgi:alkylhydroperoxidase/carboxymuconolactone decarboxylase family protein YurZ|nr:hypothetical protein [Sporichthyaceae bacterium]
MDEQLGLLGPDDKAMRTGTEYLVGAIYRAAENGLTREEIVTAFAGALGTGASAQLVELAPDVLAAILDFVAYTAEQATAA